MFGRDGSPLAFNMKGCINFEATAKEAFFKYKIVVSLT
jgi:hypothetical protein